MFEELGPLFSGVWLSCLQLLSPQRFCPVLSAPATPQAMLFPTGAARVAVCLPERGRAWVCGTFSLATFCIGCQPVASRETCNQVGGASPEPFGEGTEVPRCTS